MPKQDLPKEYEVLDRFELGDSASEEGLQVFEAGQVFTLPKGWQEDETVMQIHRGRIAFTHEENVGAAEMDLATGKRKYAKRNVTHLLPVKAKAAAAVKA